MAEACNGKVIDLLTSGYNLDVLPYAWLALIGGLAGWEIAVEEPHPGTGRHLEETAVGATEKVLAEVKGHLSPYWTCLR